MRRRGRGRAKKSPGDSVWSFGVGCQYHGMGIFGEDQNYKQSIILQWWPAGRATVTLFLLITGVCTVSHYSEFLTAGPQSSSCLHGDSQLSPQPSAHCLPQGSTSFYSNAGQGVTTVWTHGTALLHARYLLLGPAFSLPFMNISQEFLDF